MPVLICMMEAQVRSWVSSRSPNLKRNRNCDQGKKRGTLRIQKLGLLEHVPVSNTWYELRAKYFSVQ